LTLAAPRLLSMTESATKMARSTAAAPAAAAPMMRPVLDSLSTVELTTVGGVTIAVTVTGRAEVLRKVEAAVGVAITAARLLAIELAAALVEALTVMAMRTLADVITTETSETGTLTWEATAAVMAATTVLS